MGSNWFSVVVGIMVYGDNQRVFVYRSVQTSGRVYIGVGKMFGSGEMSVFAPGRKHWEVNIDNKD